MNAQFQHEMGHVASGYSWWLISPFTPGLFHHELVYCGKGNSPL